MSSRPLKVFPSTSSGRRLCHVYADRDAVRAFGGRVGGVLPPYRDHNRLITLAPGAGAGEDGVNAWFDKEKLLPGQDWEWKIRKAVHEMHRRKELC